MQYFVLLIISTVMLNDFLVKLLNLPTMLHFLPEVLSLLIIVYVAATGTHDRFRLVQPKYWILFGAFSVIILFGILNNPPGSGPVLSGMRFYLRAIPLFFLPAVLPISDTQLRRQLRWLLGLALLQLPVAAYQRWIVLDEGRYTGDNVQGTMMDSGVLSLFLISGVCILTGLLMRNRIGKLTYAVLFLLLLLPTTINETKATVVFLPMAMAVTVLFAAKRGKRLRYAGVGVLALAAFGALFVPIYNMMEVHNPFKEERDVLNFFTSEKQLSSYLSSNVTGVGTAKDVRRGDAVVVPLQFLSTDPARLAFGLGLGSVSPSNFGKNFEGPYFQLFKQFLIMSFVFFVLEFGVLGVLMIGALFWMVFADTLVVAREDDSLVGALAAGWTGVVSVFGLGIGYTLLHQFTSMTYLYWYFAGIICARRAWLARGGAVATGRRSP
ncbi:MAG: hypothetical protein ABSD02_06565 [Steroidobacteraceae bacterium]|jgi:hypothetical protein